MNKVKIILLIITAFLITSCRKECACYKEGEKLMKNAKYITKVEINGVDSTEFYEPLLRYQMNIYTSIQQHQNAPCENYYSFGPYIENTLLKSLYNIFYFILDKDKCRQLRLHDDYFKFYFENDNVVFTSPSLFNFVFKSSLNHRIYFSTNPSNRINLSNQLSAAERYWFRKEIFSDTLNFRYINGTDTLYHHFKLVNYYNDSTINKNIVIYNYDDPSYFQLCLFISRYNYSYIGTINSFPLFERLTETDINSLPNIYLNDTLYSKVFKLETKGRLIYFSPLTGIIGFTDNNKLYIRY